MTTPPPQKALGKTAKKGVVWSFVREGISEALLFPGSMVMARLLTPHEFGIAAAAAFFTQLAGRVSTLGFNAALVRAKDIRPIHLSTVFVVNLAVGLATFGGLVALAPIVSAFYRSPETGQILPVAAIAFLIGPLGTIPAALLIRNLRFREAAMVDWYQGVAYTLSAVFLAWFGFSYMSLVYGRIIATVVQTVSRVIFVRWRMSFSFSMSALREVFSFAVGSHAKTLLDYTSENIDNLIVGRFFGITALGFYDKAFSTMDRALTRMNDGGPGVMFRIFAMIHEDAERFRRAYTKVVISASMLAYPVFGVFIVTAPQLITVLFGARWQPAIVPFQILCLAAMMKLLNSYASAATQAAGYIWPEVWRGVAYTGLIVAALLALRRWGPAGAAAGVLFATAGMAILMHGLLMRVTAIRWSDVLRAQVPAVLCTATVAAGIEMSEYVVRAAVVRNPPALVLLSVQAFVAVVVYAAFALFVPYDPLRATVDELVFDLAPDSVLGRRLVRLYRRMTGNCAHDGHAASRDTGRVVGNSPIAGAPSLTE